MASLSAAHRETPSPFLEDDVESGNLHALLLHLSPEACLQAAAGHTSSTALPIIPLEDPSPFAWQEKEVGNGITNDDSSKGRECSLGSGQASGAGSLRFHRQPPHTAGDPRDPAPPGDNLRSGRAVELP